MATQNEKCFSKALKKIMKARKSLCDSLPLIQSTPILDKNDVNIISDSIDSVDRAIAKLTESFNQKTEWNDK